MLKGKKPSKYQLKHPHGAAANIVKGTGSMAADGTVMPPPGGKKAKKGKR